MFNQVATIAADSTEWSLQHGGWVDENQVHVSCLVSRLLPTILLISPITKVIGRDASLVWLTFKLLSTTDYAFAVAVLRIISQWVTVILPVTLELFRDTQAIVRTLIFSRTAIVLYPKKLQLPKPPLRTSVPVPNNDQGVQLVLKTTQGYKNPADALVIITQAKEIFPHRRLRRISNTNNTRLHAMP